jgi:hypothetical protein
MVSGFQTFEAILSLLMSVLLPALQGRPYDSLVSHPLQLKVFNIDSYVFTGKANAGLKERQP